MQHKFLLIALSLFWVLTLSAQSYTDGVYAEMDTNKGLIVLQLEFEKTPLTVTNFVGLAEGSIKSNRKGPYYDGLVFHRVIPNFMIQGGCPDGNGRGGPGYRFADEVDPSLNLKHDGPGVLSMANAGPGTNGSQFFITHVPTPWLDGKHTVFGHVFKGQDVVNKIAKGDKINSVKIVRVGDKAKNFKATQQDFERLQKEMAKKAEDKVKNRIKATEELVAKKWPNAIKTASGLKYIVTQQGKGDKPRKGATVSAHYTGKLIDGRVFDSSLRRGPFSFQVGTGQVIRGWDEALGDMRKGEKRTLIVPYHLAYGPRGYPGVIPPYATLIFDVELVDFK